MTLASNFGQLHSKHQKFIEQLAVTVLSEYSSYTDSGDEVFAAELKDHPNSKSSMNFVDKIIEKPTE
jgi:hypothetical protein